jgi:hypothetical protein
MTDCFLLGNAEALRTQSVFGFTTLRSLRLRVFIDKQVQALPSTFLTALCEFSMLAGLGENQSEWGMTH